MNARRSEYEKCLDDDGAESFTADESFKICPKLYEAIDLSREAQPKREKLLQ